MNFTGRIAAFFLHNKPLSLLILVGVVFLGVFGYMQTPKQYNPEITLPAFQITIPYKGATASEVRDYITRELEEKLSEIPGVDTISSVSYDGGMAVTRVEFFVGEPLEESKVKVFTKVLENLDKKSGTIGEPIIQNISPDNVPMIVFAFTSDTLSQNEVREKVSHLAHALQQEKGVSNILITGGEQKALKIILDPNKLRSQNISPSEVQYAIEKNIPRIPLGTLESATHEYEIELDPAITTAKKAKEILIAPGIMLGDVADVRDGYITSSSSVLLNKKDAVYLGIAKRKGENATDVANAIYNRFQQEIVKNDYDFLSTKIVRDDAQKATSEIRGLGINLLQSILIVGIVLFAFLGGRAAFLVALTIPLTLLLVFFAGYFVGQTINRITLFALILSLGLLVDSATVVVENISRHLSLSKGDKKVIPHAVSEIGIGLLLSTLTSVIVFLPVSQVGGMMGSYMGPLAFFVPMALLFSLLIAYISTPFLSSIFFSGTHVPKENMFFDRLSEKYAKILSGILKNPKKQKRILITIFSLLFAVFLLPLTAIVPFQMLPKSDQNQIYITIDLPEGSSATATQVVASEVAHTIEKNKLVLSTQTYTAVPPVIDFNGLYRGFSGRSASYQSTLKVNLVPADNRKESTEEVAIIVRKELKNILAEHKNITTRVVEEPPGPPVQATLVAKVKGSNTKDRITFSKQIEALFQQTKSVVDIDSSHKNDAKKISIAIDFQKAKQANISSADLAAALSLVGGEQTILEFHPKHSVEPAFVELSFPPPSRSSQQNLADIFVKNANGQMLPVLEFVHVLETTKTQPIFFDTHEETTFITAEMEKRSVVYAAINIISAVLKQHTFGDYSVDSWNLFRINLKNPSGETLALEWGGEWKMTLENFRDLGLAMIAAFFLVYAVLVAQFRKFLVPLLIMATIFLAFIGILPGFAVLNFFFGIPLTATGLIGFIALMGIVVNNAIIFLEYLETLKNKKMPIEDALVEAGKTRLRPILLTSLTTVLGSLTIAADPVWSGLAWTIVFGLSFSALLTLVVFPILYVRNVRG